LENTGPGNGEEAKVRVSSLRSDRLRFLEESRKWGKIVKWRRMVVIWTRLRSCNLQARAGRTTMGVLATLIDLPVPKGTKTAESRTITTRSSTQSPLRMPPTTPTPQTLPLRPTFSPKSAEFRLSFLRKWFLRLKAAIFSPSR
jgi:hypothetical protein